MARTELILREGNDETLSLTVAEEDGGGPHDLTGATLELLIKTSEDAADSDPSTVLLSSTTSDITINSPAAGTATATIDRTHLQQPGTRFWRLDVVRPGTRRTAIYGPLSIVDL
ncbi:hypothetical protein ACFXKD_27895 [Nocardiopsis aegyptia]|uniref:hypothetical protein n=1 Tax=Nocardiopsis aegyptia TaxID=220378 RepID=UPI00366D123D